MKTMNKAKKIVYGLVLGITASVFFNTVLIMKTSLWIVGLIVPVVLPVILFCVGFPILTVKTKIRIPSYPVIFIVLLLGISLGYIIPVQAQTLRFKMFSDSIPLEDNVSKELTYLSVFGADSPPQVITVVSGHKPIPAMLKYYSDYLKSNSWVEKKPASTFIIEEHYTYTKGRSKVHIIGYTTGQKSEINAVRLTRDYPAMGF